MDPCDCTIEPPWSHEDLLVKYQYISDVLIAFAYFSIPIELIYFVKKCDFFPYRWVLMQFGAFIVLCGATHFINLWTFAMHTKTVAALMAAVKLLCAFVSCATALMLVHIIPDLLSVKKQESLWKSRTDRLDQEKGLILSEEETGRHVRMLTHEIRSTYDRDTILKTTLIELGNTLVLEECALWMPSQSGSTLQLSHTLHYQTPVGSVIPINHPIVTEVFNSARAIRIPCTSPLSRIRPLVGRYIPPEVVAVRVPLLNPSDFKVSDWADLYAIMVLILPTDCPRKWRDHELELVEVVADQVAVALSHAAIIEESMQAQDQLMQQNIALNLARQDAELAIHARNDFLAVMNHEMRTPTHALIALSSLLIETELTPEHRAMIETVLKSSNLLETLTNDVLDVSRLEDGSLPLDTDMFNLHEVFREVTSLVKPMACVKKLSLSSIMAPDLPDCALGDKERLVQIILNIVGNAVKYTKEGYVSIVASVAKPDSSRDWRPPESNSTSSDGHFYLQVQVKDSGCGILPRDLPHVFTKFAQHRGGSGRNTGVTGLGLAICKRYVNLMGGYIWIESDGLDKGTKATFIVKLGHYRNSCDRKVHKAAFGGRPYHGSADLIGHKPSIRDNDGMPSRYQRSL